MLYFVGGIFLGLIVGYMIGMSMMIISEKKRNFGYIRKANDPDGGEPYLYLDLDNYPEEMANYKEVIFTVKFDDSQK